MDQQQSALENRCPECGAASVDGMGCWEMLGGLIAWEAHDSELAAEHFLTVASYNLQHPAQFTEAAYAGLRAAYIDHLDHGIAVSEIRRRVAAVARGRARVMRDAAERRPVLRRWSVTIADVYLPDRPEGAVERVRAWAKAIRGEL
jgi:hypothetical protein